MDETPTLSTPSAPQAGGKITLAIVVLVVLALVAGAAWLAVSNATRSSDVADLSEFSGSVLSYVRSNTEHRASDWGDPAGQTFLYRSFLLSEEEGYCTEFQSPDNGFSGAGMDLYTLQTAAGTEEYNAATGEDQSVESLPNILADGSTLAEVCVKDGMIYATTVAPDEQTVTPFEYDVEDQRFYAFDPVLTRDGYHQLMFDFLPNNLAFLTVGNVNDTVEWEFYALDPSAKSLDLLERCRRSQSDGEDAVTRCEREWAYSE